jgi:hypothetical protein
MSKETIEGIILVLSCQKHIDTRLKEFKLPQSQYSNWKVIYVIGDFFLENPYVLNDNYLYVKCEDSYIHLLKKLVLSIMYLYEIYEIKQGILRCGDDLIFNEANLTRFLEKSSKPDYYGTSPSGRSMINPNIEDLKQTRVDEWMVKYYLRNVGDFENPQHNLKGVDIAKYVKRPIIPIAAVGTLFYLSNRSCQILVDHMRNINFDIFHFDTFSQSYPYTIEDCAVGFILYFNKIDLIHDIDVVSGSSRDIHRVIAIHTNKYH